MIRVGAPDLSGSKLTARAAAERVAGLRQASVETPPLFPGTHEQPRLPIAVMVDAARRAPRP
jgi:hypothetical protein